MKVRVNCYRSFIMFFELGGCLTKQIISYWFMPSWLLGYLSPINIINHDLLPNSETNGVPQDKILSDHFSIIYKCPVSQLCIFFLTTRCITGFSSIIWVSLQYQDNRVSPFNCFLGLDTLTLRPVGEWTLFVCFELLG